MSCISPRRPRSPSSIKDPSGYWSTNVDGSRSLLEAMRADRRRADRLLQHRRGLCPWSRPADPRDRPDPARDALRHLEARRRAPSAGLRRRLRLRRHCAALLQRLRGRRRRPSRRGAPPGDPRHPADPADRARPAQQLQGLRRPLADAGRHLHPRLHLGARPRRGAFPRAPEAGARPDGERTTSARAPAPACANCSPRRPDSAGTRCRITSRPSVRAIRRSSSPTSPAPAQRSAGRRVGLGSTISSSPPGDGTAAGYCTEKSDVPGGRRSRWHGSSGAGTAVIAVDNGIAEHCSRQPRPCQSFSGLLQGKLVGTVKPAGRPGI